MNYSLGLLPSGHLRCFQDENATSSIPLTKTINSLCLQHKIHDALLLLTSIDNGHELPPTYHFWYEFVCLYMTARCHNITNSESALLQVSILQPLPPLKKADAQHLLHGAPPMKGSEYLSISILQEHWISLDQHLCLIIKNEFNDLSEFLQTRAPHWHQMGRVCFHLAENKNDPDYPFAFMATYSPSYSSSKSRHLPLAQAMQEYDAEEDRAQLIQLLSPIDLASKSSHLIKQLVDSGDVYHPLAWSAQEAYQFLKQVPLFEQSGIVTRLPDWWKKRPRPKVGATLSGGIKNSLNMDSLLQFEVSVALNGQKLSEQEWQELLDSENGLTLIRGQWVEIDKEKLEQAMEQMKALEEQGHNGKVTFAEGMRLLSGASSNLLATEVEDDVADWAFINADKKLTEILNNIRQPTNLKSELPNKLLKATLRPYQQTGVNWLWYLNQLGLGACLADDMGLGKTIQIISLLLILKEKNTNHPSLLVLPTSLLGNWKNELAKFAPSLNPIFIHPSMTNKQKIKELSQDKKLAGVDLVITTYGMLLRQDWLQDRQWSLLILDEAQAIKNPGALQTKASKKLKAFSRVILTGTPVENRLSDLWSLFDFINPGLLGTAARFKSFSKSLEKRSTEQYAPLRNLVQPYILRRMKTDKSIISDLPDKTEVYAYCGLTKTQAALYQKSVTELAQSLKTEDGMKRRGLILAYLLRFKQICNHPSQYLSDHTFSAKASGKFLRLKEICDEIKLRQEKVLVFTQYRTMCEPLAKFLTTCFDRPGLVLHGGVNANKRQQMVDEFQQEEGPPFFVLSIKAGGTGLTLTEASHVIHFDRWWNPAVENQATDRAFRIGQKKKVLVHKFVCLGTIEEKIDVIISEKSAMVSELLEGNSEVKLTEMNDNELLELISLNLEKTQL